MFVRYTYLYLLLCVIRQITTTIVISGMVGGGRFFGNVMLLALVANGSANSIKLWNFEKHVS
jgi:hypothetical protein